MQWNFALLVIGHLFVHGVILMSAFDAYFTTSVVQTIKPLEWCSNPSSRRIVLFVADGLRADKFFELNEKNETRAPYLRSIMQHNGTWGVSHTKAPTESRPAHVAMLGGFWEDPNGLMMGWKRNPVEFDTVLNESRETWGWGADDVLPYFNKGTAASHVHLDTHHYHESRLSNLDVWVFDRVNTFLSGAKKDETLRKKLSEDRIVFFLHLAGIDSNGHRHHPGSSNYLQNIQIVDDGVKKIVAAFQDFYEGDGRTAFLFTGDHGMTDEGGHGGDHPTEVETPFVAWGSGIVHKQPAHDQSSRPLLLERKTREWGLDCTTRMDISQVDISMLMASLIGVPYPVNSIGRIPAEYLISDESRRAEQIHGRTKQMVEAFLTKRSLVVEEEFHLFFWEYRRNEKDIVNDWENSIATLVGDKKFSEAIDSSLQLFEFALLGFQYYQKFHLFFIYPCVLFSIFGWILLCFTFALKEKGVIRESGSSKPVRHFKVFIFLAIFFAAVSLRMYLFNAPWRYYCYILIPVFVCCVIVVQFHFFIAVCKLLGLKCVLRWLSTAFVCSLWLSIICVGFYDRRLFSICFALLTVLPFFVKKGSRSYTALAVVWTTLCVCSMVFPVLPEVVKQSTRKEIVLFGGVLASLFCFCTQVYHKKQTDQNSKGLCAVDLVPLITTILPAVTGLIGYSSSHSALHSGKIIVILSFVAPFFNNSSNLLQKLTTLHAWQLSAYVLVSVSYDILFYVILTALLHIWVVLEFQSTEVKTPLLIFNEGHGVAVKTKSGENLFNDIRRALVMVFILFIGFFGIFSVESMNHFHVRVLPFLPVTNTFAMILLFAYKLCLHYLAIGVAFCTLSQLILLPLKVTWCLIACLGDVLLIHFYFSLRNSGSWAQIGFSIANLGLAAGLPVVVLLAYSIGRLMVSTPVPRMFRVL